MNTQHLSDEAVAAFADGVLRGHASERADRHVQACAECRRAVRVQREAVLALRVALPPALPGGLLARLQTLPQTTPLDPPRGLPTVVGPDGSALLVSRPEAGLRSGPGLFAPMAALVPSTPQPSARPVAARQTPVSADEHVAPHHRRTARHVRPIASAAVAVTLAGGLVAGSVDRSDGTTDAPQQSVRGTSGELTDQQVATLVSVVRPAWR